MSSQVTGQVGGGGAARDFIKDRNTGANPAACTATVTATRTGAMSMAERMVRAASVRRWRTSVEGELSLPEEDIWAASLQLLLHLVKQ